ncbi:MAG: hypothetical protein KKG00_17055 [Bacteroidetes bacterium]|mgnify:CR=1 FL=1|nr:hypothetical protein [Bacteroidota bacterium]
MGNYLTIILLFSIFGIMCTSTSSRKEFQKECYQEKIRLNTKDKQFKDTLVLFKNYPDSSDFKRIMCNDFKVTKEISDLIWECKYINSYLKYQNELGKFSIISFYQRNKNEVISSYYLCDRETKETVEMCRFRIINGLIEGINRLPGIQNNFISTEEYDDQNIEIE